MIYSIKRWKKVKNNGLILLFVDFQRDQWNKSIGGKVHLYLFLNREKNENETGILLFLFPTFKKRLTTLMYTFGCG